MRNITNDDSNRDITTRSSNMKTEGGTILLSATNTFGADTVSAGTGTLEYDGPLESSQLSALLDLSVC